jgi:hypothetical protein
MGGRGAHEARDARGLEHRSETLPLTGFQKTLGRLLAKNRSPDSYLAGGAAIHFEPNSRRYSNDLDYFHDSVERVATAFEDDRATLVQSGYNVRVEMALPGYIRSIVTGGEESTKIEWAHDSAWRFLPTVADPDIGFRLHPIDLAVNKVLTLAGRDESRDFFDTLVLIRELLPLGALCWAAAGKDPGYTPHSLLELLARRGKYQPEDFLRLRLTGPADLPKMKSDWLEALGAARDFVRTRPPDEVGCLYYSMLSRRFIEPSAGQADCVPHFGRPGGVLPRLIE